jgi:hypothetical protein
MKGKERKKEEQRFSSSDDEKGASFKERGGMASLLREKHEPPGDVIPAFVLGFLVEA